jgi:hypothetical protein
MTQNSIEILTDPFKLAMLRAIALTRCNRDVAPREDERNAHDNDVAILLNTFWAAGGTVAESDGATLAWYEATERAAGGSSRD